MNKDINNLFFLFRYIKRIKKKKIKRFIICDDGDIIIFFESGGVVIWSTEKFLGYINK